MDCSCTYARSSRNVNGIFNHLNQDFEPQSLASNFSGLTFGESVESDVSFDREMSDSDHRDQDYQAMGMNISGQQDDENSDEDIDLDAIDNDPQLYYLSPQRSQDSNDYFEPEPMIFSADSLEVHPAVDEDPMIASEMSPLSPSSSGSSELMKDIGAVFPSNADGGPSRGPWLEPNNHQGYLRLT